ncbi:MAG TPA: ABC transporter substrate-binding protein [Candidatus Methylomirabilis sp.]|nr:ABC transporter substrate-binding protein [Candidatus Methylomirabilis sp.]
MPTVRRFSRCCLLALAVLALPAPAALAQVPGVTGDTILIGSFGPLTGPNYLFGKLVMNGVEVVYNEVNKQGGVNGRKLVLVREDDRCDPATAIAAVKKLIFQDQVFMINGGGCSNAAIAARPEIEQAKVPWVVFAAVADEVTLPTSPYIFSTALAASLESYAQLDFALSHGAKKVAIVSQRDAWGRSRYGPLQEAFKKKGIAPVADEEMPADANDGTAQVLRVRQAGADAVIMLLYPKAAAIFVRDAQKVGFKPILIGQTALSDPLAFREQVGVPGALDRFFTVNQMRYTPDDPQVEKWRTLVQQYFPGDRLSVYNLFGIGSAQVVVEVLKRAGRDLTREKVRDELARLTGFETTVHPGPVTCTETDHQCHKTPAWIQLVGDKIQLVAVTPVQR